MLIQRRENDVVSYTAGVCELYGHGHLAEKYSKFAYSTAFGFSVMHSSFVLNVACPDCMLAFVIDNIVFVRKNSSSWEINGDSVYSEWSPFPGINVKTTIVPTKAGHKRCHEIESAYDCFAVDYGFSVPKFTELDYTENLMDSKAEVRTRQYICAVEGSGLCAKPEILNASPNSNILYPNTAIPGVRYWIAKGRTSIETVVNTSVTLGAIPD